MVKPKIETAKSEILDFFAKQDKKIYKWKELSKIFISKANDWNLAKNTNFRMFLDYLINENVLKQHQFNFPYQTEKRYIYDDAPLFEMILSLKPKSYFTHYTAMYLNEITDQIPKTIYLNFEQPKKRIRNSELTQEKVDFAFKNKVRTSNNIAEYQGYKIYILNGMYTGGIGVTQSKTELLGKISFTNLERTLIDITVRPVYAGGIYEVLKAFQLAHGRISINKLVATLKSLNYTYPYNQAIGFYLDKSGVYDDSQLEPLREFDMKYDFYLSHNMREIDYSNKWKLYFPKGF